MLISLACPAPVQSRKGNRVTANRWTDILVGLGHEVQFVRESPLGTPPDLMVALHARKSYPDIADYRKTYPHGPLIVALTGTDLYRDIRTSRRAQKSLELADRLVLLQPEGINELPRHLRRKARVIFQSAEPVGGRPPAHTNPFNVVVLGHLRHEKDPFRTALALRLLPEERHIRVRHLGQALSPAMDKQARRLMARDPRYRWLGEVSRGSARRRLARSHLLVLSSRMEGGANVISEAIVERVPVLASHISGSIGLLGKGYPGYYPVGDSAALADQLRRAANDPKFYQHLKQWCTDLKGLFAPARERAAWRSLLAELVH
jgi:putative glycosyltransferase (TIGR04348 family)